MMSKTYRSLIIIFCLCASGCVGLFVATAAGGAIAVVSDSRDIKTAQADSAMRHQIYKRIQDDPSFKNANITITSFHKMILLTGQVPNSLLKIKAEKIALSLRAEKIYNKISIGSKISVSKQSNDVWITAKVKSALITEPGLKSGSIKVLTEDSTVYLIGIITTDQAELAASISRKVAGVEKVVKIFRYYRLEEQK